MAEPTKEIKVAGKTVAEADVARALELLEKQKTQRAKQREAMKNNPEAAAKASARAARQRAKQSILIAKAQKAGITVTDAEIDAYLKK